MRVLRSDPIPHVTSGYVAFPSPILHAGMKGNEIYAWFMRDERTDVYGLHTKAAYVQTGEDIPDGAEYFRTVVDDTGYVYHVVIWQV